MKYLASARKQKSALSYQKGWTFGLLLFFKHTTKPMGAGHRSTWELAHNRSVQRSDCCTGQEVKAAHFHKDSSPPQAFSWRQGTQPQPAMLKELPSQLGNHSSTSWGQRESKPCVWSLCLLVCTITRDLGLRPFHARPPEHFSVFLFTVAIVLSSF